MKQRTWRFAALLASGLALDGATADPSRHAPRTTPASTVRTESLPAPTPVPPTPAPTIAAPPTSSPATATGSEAETTKNLTDVLLVIFNALLAAFTFLLWRATAGLWQATRGMLNAALEQAKDFKASIATAERSASAAHRSADIAEQTLRLTQRPTMALEGIEAVPVAEDGSHATLSGVRVAASWKNVGATFALKCRVDSRFCRELPPVAAEPPPAEPASNVGSISPAGSLEAAAVTIPIDVLDQAFGQSQPLYFVASCRYGGFSVASEAGSPHETTAVFELEMGSDPMGWSLDGELPLRFRSSPRGSFAT